MLKILNTDLNWLRKYFNDPDMDPGIEQDWEIVITHDETAKCLLTLSSEQTVRHKELVELLYLYTEAVLKNWDGCSEDALNACLKQVPNPAANDVTKWKNDTERALADPDVIDKRPYSFGDDFFANYFGHGRIF